ncbi:hypothetical protein FKR81_20510 [Lentzea tibetensis]|uniref:Uncharacterized protein n=1 Tax=Lentzea tibetensis TaxID=2591470 RepID=A0A563ESS0_9PSEU|nr:hypothetical protein FKR81_20510 [Lentzea tibetensis]
MAAAQPSNGARPDVVNSASDARPRQSVPKDDEGRTVVYVEGCQETRRPDFSDVTSVSEFLQWRANNTPV